jgi:hypothetical protein
MLYHSYCAIVLALQNASGDWPSFVSWKAFTLLPLHRESFTQTPFVPETSMRSLSALAAEVPEYVDLESADEVKWRGTFVL